MKVRDLIEYRNVEIVDIDDEFYDRGECVWRQVSPVCKSSDVSTAEDYERFLEKRVVDFKVKQSNTIVCATVSKYTDEELEERRRQNEIDKKISELTQLTGKEVILVEKQTAKKTGIICGD